MRRVDDGDSDNRNGDSDNRNGDGAGRSYSEERKKKDIIKKKLVKSTFHTVNIYIYILYLCCLSKKCLINKYSFWKI